MQTHPIPCGCQGGWTVEKSDDPRLPDERVQCAKCNGSGSIQVLDCGHPPTPGHAPGGIFEGKSACLSCAGRLELEAFLATSDRKWFGYLTKSERGFTQITNWPGKVLVTVYYSHERRFFGFGGYHTRVYWRGRDEKGREWWGLGPGMGMYTRMKRRKEKASVAA